MLRLARQEAAGDKEWEVGILMTCRLDTCVHGLLHVLPDCIAVRLDRHAAANRRVIGQTRLVDDIEIPLCEIVVLIRQLLDKFCLAFVCHACSPAFFNYYAAFLHGQQPFPPASSSASMQPVPTKNPPQEPCLLRGWDHDPTVPPR